MERVGKSIGDLAVLLISVAREIPIRGHLVEQRRNFVVPCGADSEASFDRQELDADRADFLMGRYLQSKWRN